MDFLGDGLAAWTDHEERREQVVETLLVTHTAEHLEIVDSQKFGELHFLLASIVLGLVYILGRVVVVLVEGAVDGGREAGGNVGLAVETFLGLEKRIEVGVEEIAKGLLIMEGHYGLHLPQGFALPELPHFCPRYRKHPLPQFHLAQHAKLPRVRHPLIIITQLYFPNPSRCLPNCPIPPSSPANPHLGPLIILIIKDCQMLERMLIARGTTSPRRSMKFLNVDISDKLKINRKKPLRARTEHSDHSAHQTLVSETHDENKKSFITTRKAVIYNGSCNKKHSDFPINAPLQEMSNFQRLKQHCSQIETAHFLGSKLDQKAPREIREVKQGNYLVNNQFLTLRKASQIDQNRKNLKKFSKNRKKHTANISVGQMAEAQGSEGLRKKLETTWGKFIVENCSNQLSKDRKRTSSALAKKYFGQRWQTPKRESTVLVVGSRLQSAKMRPATASTSKDRTEMKGSKSEVVVVYL